MPKKQSSTNALALGLGLAGMHAAITLWHRLPMLAAPRDARNVSPHDAEIGRMMAEKTTAAVDGFFAAQKAMIRLAGAAMTGRVDFTAIPEAFATVAVAGLRPAFRTVKANSRRLSRRS
jgi:hypothetical protein